MDDKLTVIWRIIANKQISRQTNTALYLLSLQLEIYNVTSLA